MEVRLKMQFAAVSVLCLLVFHAAHAEDPEDNMDAPQMIRFWGYPVEEYNVTTRDGFILRMHRIPYGKAGPTNCIRPVVYMQHGLECSSTNWITNLPNQSAAFIFADKGYDVWMGNFRGNYYSDKALNPQKTVDEFWAHSWDEMAEYDLPAMIDFILAHTGAKNLHYMAHSMGTMTMFAMTSSRHDYDDKIKAMYALGPVATVDYIGGLISWIAKFKGPLGWLIHALGVHEFFPENWITKIAAQTVCRFYYTEHYLCQNVFFLIAGADTRQMNETRIQVYLSHTPSGSSTRTVMHFAQGVGNNRFQKYDFGSSKANQKAYGQNTPPQYNLKNVRIPVYLFFGKDDILADARDVKMTLIPNVTTIREAYELDEFNHLDFIWGLNAPSMVQTFLRVF